ncbi:DUF4817 domain-containing protein [Trichonephila clavipes]|nr:DUF4817 domain-containing protein [Trichonephila clavipes]
MPENVARVRASIKQSPKRSARKYAAALELSDRGVRRILHRHLHIHPYKMMVTHELSERNFRTRITACKDILQNIPPGDIMISSDESQFHLSGSVNKQNFRYWPTENLQLIEVRPLHSPRETVWCAIAKFSVRGAYLLEEDTLTVISDCYCHIIETFHQPKLTLNFAIF